MEFVLKSPDISVFAGPMYLAFIALEAWLVRSGRVRGRYDMKDALTSIAMGAGYAATTFLWGALGFGIVLAAYRARVHTFDLSIGSFLLCFVIDDMRFYWLHRLSHRSRWFWAYHVAHHSSEHFNLSTALRQPWTFALTGYVIWWAPLAFIGFHPSLIVFCAALNLIFQFFLHTEAVGKLHPWFEYVFNTPSHHRVHHAANARYLDANYGGTLIVWDRLFGTFVSETAIEPPHYGLVKNITTFNPIHVALDEYLNIGRDVIAPGLRASQRVAYLFAPPGWSHDGSRVGSDALKRAYIAAHSEDGGTPGFRQQ
jgi:sterol desaturase/sphingolipid hydroxylase (fatty acid hydroxylase superfamily)